MFFLFYFYQCTLSSDDKKGGEVAIIVIYIPHPCKIFNLQPPPPPVPVSCMGLGYILYPPLLPSCSIDINCIQQNRYVLYSVRSF